MRNAFVKQNPLNFNWLMNNNLRKVLPFNTHANVSQKVVGIKPIFSVLSVVIFIEDCRRTQAAAGLKRYWR